jgi:hypothetical protein
MLEWIRNKNPDNLDELIVEFMWDQGGEGDIFSNENTRGDYDEVKFGSNCNAPVEGA